MSSTAPTESPFPFAQSPAALPPAEDDAARLIESARAAERSGQRSEARALYEAALYRLRSEDSGPRAAAVLRWIARTYMTDANPEAAMDCADAALAVALACNDKAGEGHAINVQAAIHWAQGDLDSAETLFLVARGCAFEANERALVAMTSHNLGIIANIRGDLGEALHHYTIGLENYRALERQSDVVAALNNLGRLHTDLRRWPAAEQAYSEAIEISTAIGDKSARIGLEVNVAEMHVTKGDVDRAAESLATASALSADAGDSAWLAQIAKLQGILRRDAGAPAEAERHFAQAVELSEARQDSLLLAETLRERAQLYHAEGRHRETLQNLNRAHRLFTQLQAKRELANVDRSVSRLEDYFIDVVERWGESIEAKDRYTQGHCVRVADLSCAIAAGCGISGQALFWFRIGALLHDVGKLVVPSEILNKAGKLDADEWALMRSHPSAGVDMVAGIDFPWDVRPIIESHHERWDGTGYPHGLSGEGIPLSARILAVADVYDALTSVRSYKAALTHEQALDIMRRDSGSAFDPDVFATFEAVVREGAVQPPVVRASPTQESGDAPRPELELETGDVLTGLPGRESMQRIAAQAIADRRATNGVVSLLVLQVENLPSCSVVHQRRVRRLIARELREVTRTSDFVARTGDDQFMALLPQTSARQARSIAMRVQSGLSRRLANRALDGTIASIRSAIVAAPDDGDTAAELLESADRAAASDEQGARVNRAG